MEERKFDLQKITKKLKKYLDEDRLWHTLGVMQTAAALAMVYGVPLEKAQLAGLLHDCAKCVPSKKKIRLCKDILFYCMERSEHGLRKRNIV